MLINYCECQDLHINDNFYNTGPQCRFEAEIAPIETTTTNTVTPTVEAETFYSLAQNDYVPLSSMTSLATTSQSARVYENDGSCGENACSGSGICF